MNSGNADGGARAWAETQADSKKPGENVAARDTVTRTIFAPHSTLPLARKANQK